MNSTINKKNIYVLFGPKGSGKSYIGIVIEKYFDVKFLKVEKLIIDYCHKHKIDDYMLKKHGFPLEEQALDDILLKENSVCFEATGSSIYLNEHLERLRSKYKLYSIKIHCPLEICYDRIAQRDQTEQIPVSDDRVRAINEKASRVVLDWDLEIDNSGPALIQDVISQFKGIWQL